MSGTVPRTCTVVPEPGADGNRTDTEPPRRDSRPLADFRSHDAYVLLGDPGAGKTTSFEDEVEALGYEACHLVSARDFLAIGDLSTVPPGKPLFIDGLDEVRAGQRDAWTPFEALRRRLAKLGRPRFRLSCREADWLGENDRRHLARVSPGGQVTILRLEPLTEADIKRVLAHRDDIPDPELFVLMAHDRGIDGLLANPQTLGLLADVVGGGEKWPGGRLETFEQSCRRIVREHNEEHNIASLGADGPPGVDRTLDAAGRLCAVHLLTGTAGFSTLPSGYDADWLSPDQCDYEPPDLLGHALRTKLFRGQAGGSDGRLVPVHRHVAEYLAARHLGHLVDERKLPAGRLVALMAGDDGTVVTEMRGLSAWLAARCRAARPLLINRDPIGVIQYGDVNGFADGEKRSLLGALERDLPTRDSKFGFAARLRGLATPGMETAFQGVLSSPRRDPERQQFVGLLLHVLIDGAPLLGLSESLLGVVHDPAWQSSVRMNALKAYGRSRHDHDGPDRLRTLLEDIRQGRVDDPDDDLLGTLLAQLYPGELAPRKLWELFAEPRNPDYFGAYLRFWAAIADRALDADVADHLDHLSRQPHSSRTRGHTDHLRRLRLGLVARGLFLHGDQLVRRGEIARLHDWLGVPSASDIHMGGHDGCAKNIRAWLVERPHVQKAVILEWLKRLPDDGSAPSPREAHERLHGSALPSDFGLWCLNQAVAIEHQTPRAAEYLLERAFWAAEDDRINRGLSLDAIQERTRDSDRLQVVLARSKRSRIAWAASESEWAETRRKHDDKQREEKARELAYLRSQQSALAGDQAPPGLLYQLARIYFGDFRDISADKGAGARAIEERCAGDRSLTKAILASFRGVPSRRDVPELKDIARACRENSIHPLGLPFLAGLAEFERDSREADAMDPTGSDPSMRLAVAFLFTTIHGAYRPSWYQPLLNERPEMVADVQVRIASAAWRGNQSVDCKLYELAFHSGYNRVAGFSALKLPRAFPTQCRRRYARELEYLLIAALQHSDREALREVIDSKLSRSSLGAWQRVRWLAAGWFAWPDSFANALRHHVKKRQSRWAELTAFLNSALHVAQLANGLESGSLEFLVRLLGSSVDLERFPGPWSVRARVVTPTMERTRLVRELIRRLASSHSRETGDLLEGLAGEDALSAWRSELRRARETQRAVRRDHGYRHPRASEVCRTLRGAEPANVADLAALMEDHLRQLGNEIRHGDADGWKLFWNQDSDGKPKPKSENECRDALLVALQPRLPQSLEVAREAHHARHKRSDLRVSYLGPLDQRFHVPVEIKKDEHSDLWTAIEDQLLEKYAIDPAANGHGIYLVLWFGRRKTKRSPDGERPATPEALEDRLRDALSSQQARKISVRVVDVSHGGQ